MPQQAIQALRYPSTKIDIFESKVSVKCSENWKR